MVDADGVVIVPRPNGWAADLEADLGLSPEVLHERFFKPHWQDVVLGRAGLHERLGPVLAQVAPHLSAQVLADYWFAKDAQLNETLLDDLAALRATGIQLHLATVQDHERARYLWETLGFRDRFDGLHYAADLGVKKSDPAFYATVEARTGFAGADLVFIDDTAVNVEVARAAGWRAALWTGEVRLVDLLPIAVNSVFP
jgi:putative hydrolase of the HAD superfamily